jgi:hypothetical protein
MNCAVQMGSGVMIHVPNYVQIGLGIQKLIEEIHRQTNSMQNTKAYFRKVGLKEKTI